MAEFQPPEKGKGIYLFCNIALLGFLYFCIAFRGVLTAWTAFSAAGFFLFNGFWSINKRLFSWLHREDPAGGGFLQRGWILFLALGGVLLGTGILALFLA